MTENELRIKAVEFCIKFKKQHPDVTRLFVWANAARHIKRTYGIELSKYKIGAFWHDYNQQRKQTSTEIQPEDVIIQTTKERRRNYNADTNTISADGRYV